MHKRIYAVRNGNIVSVHINGKQNYLECSEEAEAKEVMLLANTAKNGTEEEKEEAYKALSIKLDPSYAVEFLENPTNGGLSLVRNRSGEIYLKGTNVPMPKLIVDAFVSLMNDGLPYQQLVNFWSLCLQNPDESAREGLFKFLSTYNFPITDYGYFIGYKAVYFKGEKNRFLLEGLSRLMIERKIARKSMDNFHIFQDTDRKILLSAEGSDETAAYEVIKKRHIELLKEDAHETYCEDNRLGYYSDDNDSNDNVAVPKDFIDEYVKKELIHFEEAIQYVCDGIGIQSTISELLENDAADRFTDCHTRTMDIQIGKPVSMSREECDSNPNNTCSSGLHIGAPGYVQSFGYGENKAIIACLVNPADVVAVPHDYSYMKMRTSKYYPYAICELDSNGGVIEIEANYFEEDYCDYEIKELEAMLSSYSDEFVGLTKEEALELIQGRLNVISA